MSSELTPVQLAAIPAHSAVATFYQSTNLADAFAIQLPFGTSSDPEVLWRFVMSQQPSWIGWLTNARDTLVACFGLKTAKDLTALGEAKGDRIAFFKIYGRSESEIVLGEDDKHLDFRLSVLRSPDLSPTLGGQLTVSTVVHCHNLLGRAYLSVIAPFSSPGCDSQSSSCCTNRLAQGTHEIEATRLITALKSALCARRAGTERYQKVSKRPQRAHSRTTFGGGVTVTPARWSLS